MSAARVALADFAAELNAAAGAVDAWADGVAARAAGVAADHARTMAGLQAQIDALQARRAEVERTVQELQQRLAREADAEAAITAELDAARAEAAALPPQLERLRAAVAAAEAALQARVAGSDEGLRAAADRAAKLRASLAAYEAATGVRWVLPDAEGGVPGELGIEFRALDPAAPAAAARLGLRLEDSGLYTVTRCDPPLRRVAALARDLSAKRLEFGAFVRAARAEFRAAAVGR